MIDMAYAINLVDLTTHGKGDFGLMLLLAPVLTNTVVETNEAEVDHGSALLFNCDDERGAAICKIIKRQYPRSKNYMRLYHSKSGKGGWKRCD